MSIFANELIQYVICPICGSSISEMLVGLPSETLNFCPICNTKFTIKKNVLLWDNRVKTNSPQERSLLIKIKDKLKRIINPLESPLSPFVYLSRFRVNNYYKRALMDKNLAVSWKEHYLKDLSLSRGAKILDFGCGRGRIISLLSQLGYSVAGQDINYFTWWQNISSAFFQKTKRLTKLPWKTATFELVIMVMVVHYLSEEDLLTLSKEINRILVPGGKWILLEANSKSIGTRKATARFLPRLHNLDKITSIVNNEGFRLLDYSFEGFYSPVLPMTFNFIRKILNPRPLDISDYDSWIAKRLEPEQRGLWLLRLVKIA